MVKLKDEKKNFVIVLPFLGKLSLDLRTGLKNGISENLPFCKIRVIFKCSHEFPIFSSSKIKCPIACALVLFTNIRVVDTMLPMKHACI